MFTVHGFWGCTGVYSHSNEIPRKGKKESKWTSEKALNEIIYFTASMRITSNITSCKRLCY